MEFAQEQMALLSTRSRRAMASIVFFLEIQYVGEGFQMQCFKDEC